MRPQQLLDTWIHDGKHTTVAAQVSHAYVIVRDEIRRTTDADKVQRWVSGVGVRVRQRGENPRAPLEQPSVRLHTCMGGAQSTNSSRIRRT